MTIFLMVMTLFFFFFFLLLKKIVATILILYISYDQHSDLLCFDMKVNEPMVEHVYTPTFYFDQLPNNNNNNNNNTHTLPQSSTTTNLTSDPVNKPTTAQWYRAAVAPVAFDDVTFWQVMVLSSGLIFFLPVS